MSTSRKASQTSKRHQRRDAGNTQVPAPSVPADDDGLFCEKDWTDFTDKLGLSPREVRVARCVVAGQADKQIAPISRHLGEYRAHSSEKPLQGTGSGKPRRSVATARCPS